MPVPAERSWSWAPLAVLLAILLLLLVLGAALIAGPGLDSWRPEGDIRVSSGEPWDGTRTSGFTLREAESYDNHPLAWLGVEFLGYRLQQIAKDGDDVSFSYGVCRQGDLDCGAPVRLTVSPICWIPPAKVFSPETFAALPEGPAVVEQATGILVYTGTSVIHINGNASLEVLREAPPALQGFGVSVDTLGATFDAFPSPDFTGCPM